jgi:predicted nucleic-acid-binding protein
MIGLDTNILVRFFAQDDPFQTARANSLIATLSSQVPGFVSAIVLVELAWVMKRAYGISKPDLVALLDSLFRRRDLVIENRDLVFGALRSFESSKADFADCLISRSARNAGCTDTYTFDKSAASRGEMRLLF